ncbi:MAG: nucleotidyltransferase family protein [Oscillospiraceae bacterium]|nr:nucleotidyltransferase family protein [Oscillospiraceae bacterium]
MTLEQKTLLKLLRQALWEDGSSLSAEVDWNLIDTMAKQQGVISLAYDGAVALKAALPEEIRQTWNRLTLAGVVRNERLLAAQDEVLSWLDAAGIPAAILKGSSVARHYPQPELRVLGDVDILVPHAQVEQVQQILQRNGYRLHESDHNFHIGFDRAGAYVEIHYDVTTLPECRGGNAVQKETARFLDHTDCGQVHTHAFPVLSQHHHALMLLLHMVRHMTEGGIGLRQLCDWAMYLANTDTESFAQNTVPVLERCGLLRYAQIATGTCVRYLGLPKKYALWCENVDAFQTQAFLEDVLSCGNMGAADSGKIGRALAKGSTPEKKQSYLGTVFANLTRIANYRFPVTRTRKWLLPIFWVYLPVRYWVRSLLGLRQKQSVIKVAQDAKEKQEFFNMLELFETEKS